MSTRESGIGSLGNHGSYGVAEQLEVGRKLLYDPETGLHPVALSLLDQYEEPGGPVLPYREAIVTVPEASSRYEIYASNSGGLALKQIVAHERVNTEEATLLVPHSHFPSLEHTLKRTRSGGGSKLFRPPAMSVGGAFLVNETDEPGMNEYLAQYLYVAQTMQKHLIKLRTGE